jgi:prophage DNA circulation protein
MKFDKRVFWRLIAVFAVLDLLVLATGCADWESQASSIITLLGPAIQAAIAILAAFGVGVSESVMGSFNSWSAQAQTDLVTIKGLIAQYQAAVATAQPGILQEIIAVVNTTQTNLAALLTALHITDATTQARVAAVFAAITGMLTAITSLVPALQGKTSEKEKLTLYNAFKSKASGFKATFNKAAVVFGKQYEI